MLSSRGRPLREVVHTIVAGFEHSGTTAISEVLRQSSLLDSGFEGGLLLNDTPRIFPETKPFASNLCNTWNISREELLAVCDTDDFTEAYLRLRAASPVIVDKTVKLFDKTPRYMGRLTYVMERAPDIPVVCMVRDFRALMWSSFKRTGREFEDWLETTLPLTTRHTRGYCDGAIAARERFGDARVKIVRHEDLSLKPRETVQDICRFIGLEYSDELLRFPNKKYDLAHGDTLQAKYCFEYREHLPPTVIARIEHEFRDYPDWFYE